MGYPNYKISSFGHVKNGSNRVLKPVEKIGYKCINLSKNNKLNSFKMNRLVAIAFIANPKKKQKVNHIDGNKLNDHVSNLEWATPSENSQHAIDTNLNDCCRAVNQYSLDKQFIKRWKSVSEADRAMNVHHASISNNCNKKNEIIMWLLLEICRRFKEKEN